MGADWCCLQGVFLAKNIFSKKISKKMTFLHLIVSRSPALIPSSQSQYMYAATAASASGNTLTFTALLFFLFLLLYRSRPCHLFHLPCLVPPLPYPPTSSLFFAKDFFYSLHAWASLSTSTSPLAFFGFVIGSCTQHRRTRINRKSWVFFGEIF